MIVLDSGQLELLVLSEVGGKIGQIRDKTTRREFLVQPQRPYKTIAAGESWLDHDTSGMDDCFPNIAAGRYPFEGWTGIDLPDLGEWTHGIWRLNTVTNSEIVLERSGGGLPYFVRKRISFADDRTIDLSYRLENKGTQPFRYMGSAHPLISVAGGFELILPAGQMTFRSFPADTQFYTWPYYRDTDLSHQWIPEGTTLKIFVTGIREGWCELRQRWGVLRFAFDPHTTPVLGLWFNNLGFPAVGGAPFRCIAVEPCTSPSDLLDELPPDAYPIIKPGGTNEWRLRINVRPASNISEEKKSGYV